MRIEYSSKFVRQYRKLSPAVKHAAEQSELLFRHNPRDHRLKTHKLKGHLQGLLSFSITPKHRIVFEFIDAKTVLFHAVGDHHIYR